MYGIYVAKKHYYPEINCSLNHLWIGLHYIHPIMYMYNYIIDREKILLDTIISKSNSHYIINYTYQLYHTII